MKMLKRAYKSAIDNGNKTGAGRVTVPFQEEMDELFGDNPPISSTHLSEIGNLPDISNNLQVERGTSSYDGRRRHTQVQGVLQGDL